MELHVLFGQRAESYEGEHAPEAFLVWDGGSVDENPEGFKRAVDEAKAELSSDIVATRVIVVRVDGERIRRLLIGTPVVEGGILTGGEPE